MTLECSTASLRAWLASAARISRPVAIKQLSLPLSHSPFFSMLVHVCFYSVTCELVCLEKPGTVEERDTTVQTVRQ